MAETQTKPRLDSPFGSRGLESAFAELSPAPERFLPTLQPAGASRQPETPQFVTAQKVDVPRDPLRVLTRMKVYAAAAGEDYYYSWEAKSDDGRKSAVEGPSVSLARDLAREWGNCDVNCFVAQETATHWVFWARFIDLETGYSYAKTYRQRRSQKTGMERKDPGRAEDLVFQIGQSKAIRGVIVDSLKTFSEEIMMEAKKSLLEAITNDMEKSRAGLLVAFEGLRVPLPNVERQVGRVAKVWRAQDMAKLWAQIRTVRDGFSYPEDIWPDPETVTEDGEVVETKPKEAAKEPAKTSTTSRATTSRKQASKQQEKPKDEADDGAGVRGREAEATPHDQADDGVKPAGGSPQGHGETGIQDSAAAEGGAEAQERPADATTRAQSQGPAAKAAPPETDSGELEFGS